MNDQAREALSAAKAAVNENRYAQALNLLKAAFTPETDFSLLVRANKWLHSVEWPDLKPLKVAFLGGGTIDHTVEMVSFWLALSGFKLEPYLAPYDSWRVEVLRQNGNLYRFAPDIVWFLTNNNDIQMAESPGNDPQESVRNVDSAIGELESLWAKVKMALPAAMLIQNNMVGKPERVFGNLDSSLPIGFSYQQRLFNLRLIELAQNNAVTIFDISHLASCCGLWKWHDYSYWHHSKHPFSPQLSGWVGFYQARVLAAARSGAKKVIVLDLDNTLWGGVAADDGLEGIALGNGADGEAYTAFQRYLKQLSQSGIVLTVASKNEDAVARGVFTQHPEMVLSLDDIAVFKANWRNKADNIRETAAILNLGLDSFVFLDDNPAERALVRQELPMVEVPDLPEDPAEYIQTLDSRAYFEALSFSAEDRERTRMYRENSARAEIKISATNVEDYLRGLEMVGSGGFADTFHLPRMSQLVNKSNQFHPTTTRYTEAELKAFSERDDFIVRQYSLSDKFGDYGLISVLVLEIKDNTAIIDTWVLSCRVLERGMEEFILRDLLKIAAVKGVSELEGRYIPTKKNVLVAELYDRLGFEKIPACEGDDCAKWSLSLQQTERTSPLFIKNKEL